MACNFRTSLTLVIHFFVHFDMSFTQLFSQLYHIRRCYVCAEEKTEQMVKTRENEGD